MSSLAQTYNGSPVGALWSRRQLILGVTVFVLGVIMSVSAIVAGATDFFIQAWDMTIYQSWELAGVLGGIGVPFIFIGVFTVLPASTRLRAAASLGFGITLVGTYLFFQNFPNQWYGDPVNNAPLVLAVYAAGFGITLWCLFSAVVGFKTRNMPGGTVSLRMVIQGRERVVEVSREDFERGMAGGSGVGLFGNPSTDYVETQTAMQSEQAQQRGQPTARQAQQQSSTQQNTEFDSDGSPSMRDAEVFSDD